MSLLILVGHLHEELVVGVVITQRDVAVKGVATYQVTGFALFAHEHLLSAQRAALQVSSDAPFCLHVSVRQRMVEVQLVLAHVERQFTLLGVPVLQVPVAQGIYLFLSLNGHCHDKHGKAHINSFQFHVITFKGLSILFSHDVLLSFYRDFEY